jgi:PBP1b-binding outer membrane lipoprotein LpoB
MNKILSKISIVAASAMIFVGCEAIDPLDVVNPNLSENSLVGQPNSAASWLNGLERQLAVTANNNLLVAEIASDNYVNTQTFFNQFVDNLTIDY